MVGHISSLQSLGTLDGPGVRFVVFLQGCNLRCACCHNPETWPLSGGTDYTPEALLKKVLPYREYFGTRGGVTLSGGEPLLQAPFAAAFFRLCRENHIHTCLDTSGSLLNDAVLALLDETDMVLLDIKYTNEEAYQKYVGCSLSAPLQFLDVLDARRIPTTIRQVIIPSLNDTLENIEALHRFKKAHASVKTIELLPFRRLCQTKYDALCIPFPLAEVPSPTKSEMEALERHLEVLNA